MATIQERQGRRGTRYFRVQVRLKGYPPQSASFARKTDARKWAEQTESAMREGRHFKSIEAKRHTVGEMITRYKKRIMPGKARNTRQAQDTQLEWWNARFGHYVLADITPAMVAEARDDLIASTTRFKRRMSPSTVVRYMSVLSHCFNVAMKEWGWIDDSPMRRVTKPREPKGRVRFLSDEERVSLLAECKRSRNPVLYDVVMLALCTGMRRSEIMCLSWDRVDLHRGVITLEPEDTKTQERRAVPLVGHALEILKSRAAARIVDNPYVFPSPERFNGKPKSYDIQSAWDFAIKRAGIKNFRFHDLRHSAASYLAMNGASLSEIAEVLGHKTLAMVKRYAHLSHAHTSKVVERMVSAMFSPSCNTEKSPEDEIDAPEPPINSGESEQTE